MNIFQAIEAAVAACHDIRRPRIYLAWVHEEDGWVSHEVEAVNYDEAERKANERFVGTKAFWSMEVDREPVR